MTYVILAHRSKYSILGPAVAPIKSNGKLRMFATREAAEYEMQEYINDIRSPNVHFTVALVEGSEFHMEK